MKFYGDFGDISFGVGPRHNLISHPMSTAIVRVYTHEGFVIAADGRMMGRGDKTPASESRQKIFPIADSPERCLAYTANGTCLITRDTGEVFWDLFTEIAASAKNLSDTRTSNLYGYAQRLSKPITRLLAEAKNTGIISEYATHPGYTDKAGSSIVEVLIDGFVNSAPSSICIRIFHQNQVLAAPSISPVEMVKGRCEIRGSGSIGKIFFDPQDPRLFKYGKPNRILDYDLTITEAIRVARGYIRACSSDEGRQLDETGCAKIGGRIHIATVTPTDGFKWIIPPRED